MYTFEDKIEDAEMEFEEFNYSYCIRDASGEVYALCCTEESAQRIVDALNA